MNMSAKCPVIFVQALMHHVYNKILQLCIANPPVVSVMPNKGIFLGARSPASPKKIISNTERMLIDFLLMTENIRTLSPCNWISKNSNKSNAKKKSAAEAASRSVVSSRSRAFATHSVTVRPTTMNWMTIKASGSIPFGAESWNITEIGVMWCFLTYQVFNYNMVTSLPGN